MYYLKSIKLYHIVICESQKYTLEARRVIIILNYYLQTLVINISLEDRHN